MKGPSRKTAAVALILAPGRELLLVKRASRAGDRWSGHMALPGGRFEPSDGELLTTAIRETREETGVALAPAALTRTLEDLAPVTKSLPSIVVRPFVFSLAEKPALRLNEELTAAYWFSLEALERSRGEATVHIRGAAVRVPAFVLAPDCVVWGMTYRILSGFLKD